jgi:hypothetical protein
MKISVQYNEVENQETISVVTAKYLGNYTMQIEFNDGSEKFVDFEPFLTKSLHPSIQKYLNTTVFETVNIVDGNLNWNDYDMIFPVWDLYNGAV